MIFEPSRWQSWLLLDKWSRQIHTLRTHLETWISTEFVSWSSIELWKWDMWEYEWYMCGKCFHVRTSNPWHSVLSEACLSITTKTKLRHRTCRSATTEWDITDVSIPKIAQHKHDVSIADSPFSNAIAFRIENDTSIKLLNNRFLSVICVLSWSSKTSAMSK